MSKILVVEDNKNLRENIIFLLKKNNFLWEWAFCWEEALSKCQLWMEKNFWLK